MEYGWRIDMVATTYDCGGLAIVGERKGTVFV